MTFHDRCLNMLRPMLSDSDRVNDDCELKTTTILHLYDGLEYKTDPRLSGRTLYLFFILWLAMTCHDISRKLPSSSLRKLYAIPLNSAGQSSGYISAKRYTTPTCISAALSPILATATLSPRTSLGMTTCGFTKRCKLLLRYQNGPLARKRHMPDSTSFARWWTCGRADTLPASTRCTRDSQNGRHFLEVCYATDEHVAAAHFFYMAKHLLTTHDPNLPWIGPWMKSAAVVMQETALSYVRALVGIAVWNNFIPTRFTASLAIIICDSWFTDREQEALLDFMRDASRCSGWERQNAQRALVDEWGWKEE